MSTLNAVTAGPFPFGGQYRNLIWELSKREVFGRYRGASLGVLWSVLNPFLMLAVYTVAFGEILRSRWPGAESSKDFAVILFVGLIIHGFFAECLSRAPTLIVANANYVKRIVFPLEVLSWPVVLSALFHLGVNFLVFGFCVLVLKGGLHWTFVLLPIVVAPLVLVAVGTVWFFSALGVYFRDINQLVTPLAASMLFLSSAIIPVQSLPERFQPVFLANPLTMIIDQARAVALQGDLPDFAALGIYTAIALAWSLMGYAMFKRVRGGFADVL